MFRSENNIIIITFHRYHIRSTSRYGSRQDFFEDILDKADENLIQDDLAKMRPKRNTHQRIRVEMEYKEYSSETRSELVMSPSSRDQELLGKLFNGIFVYFFTKPLNNARQTFYKILTQKIGVIYLIYCM